MSKGVNKVFLIGNLGNDPEVRQTSTGNAVANASLATSDSWRDKESGELQERTEWHRLVFFNRLAEIVGEYLHKGSKIYVEGIIRTRKWTDKEGIERYTTEIVVNEMHMLGDKSSESNSTPRPTEQQAAPAPRGKLQQAVHSRPAEVADEDIPF